MGRQRPGKAKNRGDLAPHRGRALAAASLAAGVAAAAWYFAGASPGARARTETYNASCGAHITHVEAARASAPRLARMASLDGSSSRPYAPSDASAPSLPDQLLSPLGFAALVADHLAAAAEPRALHLSRGNATGHYAQLADSRLVERVIAHGAATHAPERRPPRNHADVSLLTRVRQHGELRTGKYGHADAALSMAEVAAKFGAGFTLLINDVDQRSAAIASLCEALEAALGAPVNANAYFTRAGAQGFEAHFDPMDVLVLQLEGEKEWTLYEPFLPLADLERKWAPSGALLAASSSARVSLRPGDLLYLPRGTPHEAAARAGGAHSMHVTLGFLKRGATWAGLVHAAVEGCAAGRSACPEAARAAVRGSEPSTGLRWAALLHAAVRALTWSAEPVGLELRGGLPLHAAGWARAEETAAKLGALLRRSTRGGGIELSSSAFAWSEAAAVSENGGADPYILRPEAAADWSAAGETAAGWRALDAGIRARLDALAGAAGQLARLGAAAIERGNAERVGVRQAARRRGLEWHGEPGIGEAPRRGYVGG